MNRKKTVIEDGIIAGNLYDKYGSSNPISKYLVSTFIRSVSQLCDFVNVSKIHEIGCGEGHLSIALAKKKPEIYWRACDFSPQIIEVAQDNARKAEVKIDFKTANIYDLSPEKDACELILCCEVLEHLENPLGALEVLSTLASPYLIVSVPREPLWRILNVMRGKYVTSFGNTPGHLQHWSKNSFIKMLDGYVEIVKVLTPLPWTVVLCRSKRKTYEIPPNIIH